MAAELRDSGGAPYSSRGRIDKRRLILDAAAEMFGEQGYERASLDAIAAKAGVSKPTIYSHFGTKDQLFRDSLAESAARINAESMEAITSLDVDARRWREGLYEVASGLVECERSECAQSVLRQTYAELRRDPEVFRAVRARAADPIIQALAGRLAILANAGYLRISDPELAAKQFIALTRAEIVELTEPGSRSPRAAAPARAAAQRAATAAVDTFLAAFENPQHAVEGGGATRQRGAASRRLRSHS
jgi:AcrR family transcriptional regulator